MGRNILTEDEEISGTVASNVLMDAGHAVGWLKDGKDVLAALIRRPSNLVIPDCNMPCLNGVTVLREMRRRPDLCENPGPDADGANERFGPEHRPLCRGQ